MPLNDDFKERLKAAADIKEIALALGLTERAGRFFCPVCQPTGGKSPDLAVKDGGFICHKCKAKGDVFALVQIAGVVQDFPAAVKWVADRTGLRREARSYTARKQRTLSPAKVENVPGKVSGAPEKTPQRASYEDIFSGFLAHCRKVEGKPLEWLTRDKKISPDVVAALGLRFCGREYLDAMTKLEGRFGNDRVRASGLWSFYGYFKAQVGFLVIPYYQDGRPVYLKARPPLSKERAAEKDVDRFRNTAAKIPCLYNIDVLQTKPERVYICEGESDTWAALTFGEAAVGSPGAGDFKPEWVEAFRGLEVQLVPDRDKAGKQGARTIADLFIKAGLPCPGEVKIPEPFKDLGEYLRGKE